MKRLTREKRALILKCFTEGLGVNATARMAGVSNNTVLKFLADIGPVCREYQARTLTNLACKRIQVDEIWSFTAMKAKNVPPELKGMWGVGDTWTWVALCADSRLAVTWLVGPGFGVTRMLWPCSKPWSRTPLRWGLAARTGGILQLRLHHDPSPSQTWTRLHSSEQKA